MNEKQEIAEVNQPQIETVKIDAVVVEREEREKFFQAWLVRGRRNLLVIAVLSSANLILSLLRATISFPFSIFLPGFILEMGLYAGESFGSSLAAPIMAVTAIVMLGVFWLLWFLAKKHIAPVWIYMVLFALDFLFLLIIGIASGSVQNFLIDFAFHVWAMFSIVRYLLRRLAHKKWTAECAAVVQENGAAL